MKTITLDLGTPSVTKRPKNPKTPKPQNPKQNNTYCNNFLMEDYTDDSFNEFSLIINRIVSLFDFVLKMLYIFKYNFDNFVHTKQYVLSIAKNKQKRNQRFRDT